MRPSLVRLSFAQIILLAAILLGVVPTARIAKAFHVAPQRTTRLGNAASMPMSPTALFLSAVPRDPVVPQDDFDFSPSILQQQTPVPPRRMELPARSRASDSVSSMAERLTGRVAMVAAIWLVLQELQTGQSMPDQLMDAAHFIGASL